MTALTSSDGLAYAATGLRVHRRRDSAAPRAGTSELRHGPVAPAVTGLRGRQRDSPQRRRKAARVAQGDLFKFYGR